MRQIGINVSKNITFGTEEFLSCIAKTGFDCIFTCGNDDEFVSFVRKKCLEYKLIYETLHAPFDGINRLWFKEEGKELIDELCHSVDLAAENGIGIVITHLSSKENCPPVTDAGLMHFDRLVNYAAKKNVKIAVENQRKLGNIATILEQYGKDTNVGFCWDVGHEKCFARGREYMPLFGDRCIATHIHDNNLIHNCDEHLLPFDGQIDFRRTAELLKTYDYKGSLMLEVDLPGARSDKYTNFTLQQFVQKAYAAVNRLRIISEY